MFLRVSSADGYFLYSKASSRGQSIDVFSGTENIPQLNINLHGSDEIFRKLQAEALEGIQASEGNAQWYWPEGFGIPGADAIDTIRPVVRVFVYAYSRPFSSHVILSVLQSRRFPNRF